MKSKYCPEGIGDGTRGRLLIRRGVGVVRNLLLLLGVAFVLQMLLALHGMPQPLMRWITGAKEGSREAPQYVVVLGGGGIPSGSGLVRTYHAAAFVGGRTNVEVIVSLPADQDPETSSVGRMRDELVLHGVSRSCIRMEYRGLNTHEQAVNVRRMLGEAALSRPLVIVTSPTHVRRSLMCFRRQGFARVSALAAFNADVEADLGSGTGVRYGFWSALELQVEVLRELCALVVYRIRGWI